MMQSHHMRDATSLGSIFAIQGRVIGAMVLREVRTTFGSSVMGYVWAILTPTVGVAMMVMIFTAIGRVAPFGTSLALFFATGFLTLDMFRKMSNSLMGVLTANKGLLTYPPIKETDVILARFLVIFVTYVFIMIVFYGALIWLDLAELPAYWHELFLAVAAVAMLGLGFGMVNMFIIMRWYAWRHIERILTRPLFFLSGIFYVPSQLPSEAIAILKWNPVLHGIEWIRNGYYPNYDSSVLDKTYMLSVIACLLLVGLGGERLTRRGRG